MSRPVSTFLNEVVQYLEEEVLPDAYTETSYFDNCATRVELDDERVGIQDLSHCVKDQDGPIVRVNDILKRSRIQIDFQIDGDLMHGSWTEGLAQCTIGLYVPKTETPIVPKWEQRDETSGILKADEWYDHEREYIEQDISARDAIETAIWEHFEATVPSFRDQSSMSPIPATLVQTLYNEDHQIIEELNPITVQ